MNPTKFVAKWGGVVQKERAVSQEHFIDLCRLVGHKTPVEYDPTGEDFAFEPLTEKPDGTRGFADVFFRGRFIWEYKGPDKDLDKAYQQLQLYREDLHNPPLLITSDIHTIIIHTNFTNYPTQKHTLKLDDLLQEAGLQKLRWIFYEPERFQPPREKEEITKATAETFVAVAAAMKQHQRVTGEEYTPEQLAHFMVRLLFCLFAEDLGLLPNKVFTQIVRAQDQQYANLKHGLRNLFREMRDGGTFGYTTIRHFDGTLFDDEFVPEIPHDLARALLRAAVQDWSAVDPSIFGTLFERVIDEDKRAQLGAHYTSESDIMLIVEPVLMAPYKEKWETVRRQADRLVREGSRAAAHHLLAGFSAELAAIRVLDPACGSGNFLYVALRELLNLQKKVIAWAVRRELAELTGLAPLELTVSPEQLFGIEINPYAHELAQITAWIGYLQWRFENGFGELADPVLKPLRNIQRMDAILAYDENGRPIEPEWPAADVIIGNPPFLGDRKMRSELGDEYVDQLRKLFRERLPSSSDLVCYWFEQARTQIEDNPKIRVGLIATNSIRGGSNRVALDRIKKTGDIFMAWSDKTWILEGAAVRVSITGFDDGTEKSKTLDGVSVSTINSDLTSDVDLSRAKTLEENSGISFQGVLFRGSFDIEQQIAREFLADKSNPSKRPNSDVIKPRFNAIDVTRRPTNMFVIAYDVGTPIEIASQYKKPFEYLKKHVFPLRQNARETSAREEWWIHWRPRPAMYEAMESLSKYIATPAVSKHRIFIWVEAEVVPTHALITFAREDDYFFGVLHSRPHEIWALRLGTSLEDRPRYTPTTSFETFPFPWPPGQEPAESEDGRVREIAIWARALDDWRQRWLNPQPPQPGVVDVVYNRLLKNRTLTNLYNGLTYYRQTVGAGLVPARPVPAQPFDRATFDKETRHSVTRPEIEELNDIHAGLDTAVLQAYGWPPTLTDEQILEHLLTLNLQRATP